MCNSNEDIIRGLHLKIALLLIPYIPIQLCDHFTQFEHLGIDQMLKVSIIFDSIVGRIGVFFLTRFTNRSSSESSDRKKNNLKKLK